MMRFPQADQLSLPCVFERLVPGRQHSDGRRYLPLIVLRPLDARLPTIGVVDRHHRVEPAHVGQTGSARLVLLLSRLALQEAPGRQGLVAEAGLAPGHASLAPEAYGRVVAVPTWEAEREQLPYEELFVELLLDVGGGTLGVRTGMTAADLAAALGAARILPGDWVRVWRSRVDILAFDPLSHG